MKNLITLSIFLFSISIPAFSIVNLPTGNGDELQGQYLVSFGEIYFDENYMSMVHLDVQTAGEIVLVHDYGLPSQTLYFQYASVGSYDIDVSSGNWSLHANGGSVTISWDYLIANATLQESGDMILVGQNLLYYNSSDLLMNLRKEGCLILGDYSNFDTNMIYGKLMIKGDGANEGVTIWDNDGATTWRLWANKSKNLGYLTRGADMTKGLAVATNGNIGIGIDPITDYKLAVDGTIGATEIVIVEALTADFVFAEDYELKSLDEVETFVNENKHLPDVPSAKHMEENGMGVAKMNQLLLQKVEELTLYMIEMKKENEALKSRLELIESTTELTPNN